MRNLQPQLRLKGQVIVDEFIIRYAGEWMLLKPGDTYLAEREGEDSEVLTVRRVEVQRRPSGLAIGKVFPKERKKKLYELHECVRVIILNNPNPPKKEEVDGGISTDQDRPERREPNPPREDRNQPREGDGTAGDPRKPAGRVNYSKQYASRKADAGPVDQREPGPSR